ncbi:amidohydrolase family protein [Methylosinus sp. LW3]|uniref:amidohydrolase family protein n=1 Tax=Methylosinus sp. LW3 TaxID=107635 RepID=UPI000465C59A|nr:amidohydrolase family protein [Methylosinus sp. LW3]
MKAKDLIIVDAEVTTLDRANPVARAVAIRDGKFLAVGSEAEIRAAAPDADVIDAGGRRLVPGLIDSHIHVIRGGLNYNMELRWDGVPTLADAMAMLKKQAENTPPPQWVRVGGGFTEHQFAEKRLPTLDEINAAAPETPVFILHLYDRALLNAAALRVVGYTKDTPNPPGGEIVRDATGNPTGLLLARPNAMILYSTLAKGPKLPHDYQLNSTRHFMRELNSLGVTSVIDAGGGFQNYPDDYQIIETLHRDGELTLRIAYNLFTQKPREELADFANWSTKVKPGDGDDLYRHNGAGEMLVYSAADFEDFRVERPDMPASMEADLEPVVRLLAERKWPWRLHATYDETIGRALDVFEKVDKDIPLAGLNWFFDHAETVGERNIDRIAALGGGVAVQHRMAFQGEYFVERYGAKAAEATPPITRMMAAGLKVGAGTDATRVASYNPWVSLSWLVTGRTLGGLTLYPARKVTTGLVDAISVLGLGKVFTANMTGNIVFLGLAATGAPGFEVTPYLVALSAFLLGALGAGRIGRAHAGLPLRRWLTAAAIIEALLIWASAVMAFGVEATSPRSTIMIYAIIAFTAVAMGFRNATIRQLKIPDLTTTVLTLTLTGLAADSPLAGGANANWPRRLGSVAAIFLGAGIGAFLVVHSGLAAPLFLAGALILLGTILCALHPASSEPAKG